jgi:hypothetical protein
LAAGIFAATAWIESRTRWKAGQGAGVVQKLWTEVRKWKSLWKVEKSLESGKVAKKWKNRQKRENPLQDLP